MPLAAKDASALTMFPGAPAPDEMAGSLVAAMMLPVTLMMTGWMALLGASFGAARAFAGAARDEASAEQAAPTVVAITPPAPSAPRLVVSNPDPVARVPAQAAVKAKVAPTPAPKAAKPVPAKPSGAPPKPSKPGGSPPKPKASATVVPAAAAPPAPMPIIEAAKPAPAKPSGAPPKPAKPGGIPPKPKSAKPEVVVVKAAPAKAKAAPAKAALAKAAPLKIEKQATSKGISLAKVSMQDKPGEPDKK